MRVKRALVLKTRNETLHDDETVISMRHQCHDICLIGYGKVDVWHDNILLDSTRNGYGTILV